MFCVFDFSQQPQAENTQCSRSVTVLTVLGAVFLATLITFFATKNHYKPDDVPDAYDANVVYKVKLSTLFSYKVFNCFEILNHNVHVYQSLHI